MEFSMADHGNEYVLARFNTLMREVSRGKTQRTCSSGPGN